MRLLVSTTAGVGHLRPLLPFASAARDAGHEVLFAAPRSLAAKVESYGYRVMPFDDASAAAPMGMSAADDRPLFARIIGDPAPRAALPGLLATFEQFRPDLVLRDDAEMGSMVAAEAHGVPDIAVFSSVHRAQVRLLSAALPLLGPARVVAGLPEQGGESLADMRVVSLFPESFDPADGPPPPHRFRTGGTVRKVARTRPLIYLSFGTIASASAMGGALLRETVGALAALPVDLVVSIGRGGNPAQWQGANVDARPWVDEDEVLPQSAAVVCHGGGGTTLAALRSGVPLVVLPQFGDQPAVAEAVQASGAGLGLSRRPGPAATREAVEQVLGKPSFGTRVRAIADDIAALPDVAEAVHLFAETARLPR
ncbi:glycosyltransferase family 1 protein [Actinoplanes sp. TBRC 11911]|uniref:glycosyltransferase n=1 Tax=Actinoplanes sp. TBRC 11911 TaxID=2729386 RepID=UPI00145D799C|nr:glycosyltransferase [Actinoplanes sp. TBRC 11911]NMO49736.1 glycosyltransferase family 1 protein [Actinoplanes sp. TBRC 11911]